jgi:predicted transcriptional regulator
VCIIPLDMEDLNLIKKRRVALGVTQKELSKLCGVSQSMIAKVEAGRAEASYTIAKKIFETLDSLAHAGEPKVKDFMSRKVVFCDASEKIHEVVEKMNKGGISQLPVLKRGGLVGSISEGGLLENMDKLSDVTEVGDIMKDAPPVVSENTSRNSAISLLKEFPFIMVRDKKGFSGLITKSDVLGGM